MGQAAEVLRGELAAASAQDVEGLRASWNPNCQKWVPGAYLQGADQVLAWDQALWEAFPDFQVVPTQIVEEGSTLGFHARVTGTHQGTLRTPTGDIPPTGRRLEVTLSGVCEVHGDQIISMHMNFDRLEILEQLGVAAAPAPT
jgi:predicted ester cyclase